MAIDDATYRLSRATFGGNRAFGLKNTISFSFGSTQGKKRPAAGSTTALLAATAVSGSGATTLTPTTLTLDVPRAVSLTFGGTAASIAGTAATVTGTNVEGKTITDSVTPTATTAGTYNGAKAFKTITSVSVPTQGGSGVTVAIGTLNIFGLNHRLPASTPAAQVRVFTTTQARNSTTKYINWTAQAAPTTLNSSATLVESNTFVPATLPDGTFYWSVHYYYVNWHLRPTNDDPNYGPYPGNG